MQVDAVTICGTDLHILGADIVVNSGRQDPEAVIAELTGGLGANVTMEAVGTPQTFELAVRLARPRGHVANVGVHSAPATLHLEDIWIKNLTITTGLVDTYSTPRVGLREPPRRPD